MLLGGTPLYYCATCAYPLRSYMEYHGMKVQGLLIQGAIILLTSEDENAVSEEPVYLPAEAIDAAIFNGTLEPGAFNNVQVTPPVEVWPERWKFLKE